MNDSARDGSPVNDSGILDLVDGSFGGVHMNRPIDEITARGRRLRTRRKSLAGVAAVGVVGASLAVALPLSGSSGQPGVARGPAGPAVVARTPNSGQVVNVDLAAWSVHTNADATVTLTVREYQDPVWMEQELGRAGVSAVVTQGANCALNIDGLPVISKVVDNYSHYTKSDPYITVITPSAMPPGTSLFINFAGADTPNWVVSMGVQYHANVDRLPASCLTSVNGQK